MFTFCSTIPNDTNASVSNSVDKRVTSYILYDAGVYGTTHLYSEDKELGKRLCRLINDMKQDERPFNMVIINSMEAFDAYKKMNNIKTVTEIRCEALAKLSDEERMVLGIKNKFDENGCEIFPDFKF